MALTFFTIIHRNATYYGIVVKSQCLLGIWDSKIGTMLTHFHIAMNITYYWDIKFYLSSNFTYITCKNSTDGISLNFIKQLRTIFKMNNYYNEICIILLV